MADRFRLRVYTPERERLIGPHGETLEEIQFLLNRVLQAKDKDAPRVNAGRNWR